MKLLKTKMICFFSMLLLTLLGTNSFAQLQVGTPTDATIAAHLQTADARVLKDYLTRNGYTDAGLNQEGVASYSQLDNAAAPSNVIVVNSYRNAAGNSIDLYSTSETADGITSYVTRAEDARFDYIVAGGTVTVAAKSSINWQKVLDCYNKYLKGNTQSCVTCYNCLKNCINAGGSTWKKLKCCLGCGSCWNCLKSIWNFFWCVF